MTAVAAAPPGECVAEATELVDFARRVPSSLRSFEVDATEARRVFGIEPPTLEQLLDLGLPAKTMDRRARCDRFDLANLALHLGLASLQRHAMVGSTRTLEAATRHATVRYALDYRPHCERCGPGSPGDWRFVVPPGRRVAARTAYRATIERATAWPELPPAAADIAAYLSDFWFWQLPWPLRRDVGFARENRLAGCYLAARLTVEESRGTGLQTRVSFGIQVEVPFSETHFWSEVRVEDRWVPFDPHLLRVLARHAGLDPERWPPTRSPGAILVPLPGDYDEPVVRHDGHATRASIATRVLTQREGGGGPA
jgi:hypothetical protein